MNGAEAGADVLEIKWVWTTGTGISQSCTAYLQYLLDVASSKRAEEYFLSACLFGHVQLKAQAVLRTLSILILVSTPQNKSPIPFLKLFIKHNS